VAEGEEEQTGHLANEAVAVRAQVVTAFLPGEATFEAARTSEAGSGEATGPMAEPEEKLVEVSNKAGRRGKNR